MITNDMVDKSKRTARNNARIKDNIYDLISALDEDLAMQIKKDLEDLDIDAIRKENKKNKRTKQ